MTNSEEMKMIFLVADLSGYTALTEAHGGESAASIVTRYFESRRPEIRSCRTCFISAISARTYPKH